VVISKDWPLVREVTRAIGQREGILASTRPRLFGPVILAALLARALLGTEATAAAEGIKIITHGSNAVQSLTAKQVSAFLLKDVTRWSDGTRAVPADLAPSSEVRKAFTTAIHRREVRAIQYLWNQRVFSGTSTPPLELASEAEMVRFVADTPGAIGYVANDTALPEGVRVILLVN
jgi:hypothetical protein